MAAAAPWDDVLLALAPDAPEEVAELPIPVPVVAPVLAAEPVVDAPVSLTAV